MFMKGHIIPQSLGGKTAVKASGYIDNNMSMYDDALREFLHEQVSVNIYSSIFHGSSDICEGKIFNKDHNWLIQANLSRHIKSIAIAGMSMEVTNFRYSLPICYSAPLLLYDLPKSRTDFMLYKCKKAGMSNDWVRSSYSTANRMKNPVYQLYIPACVSALNSSLLAIEFIGRDYFLLDDMDKFYKLREKAAIEKKNLDRNDLDLLLSSVAIVSSSSCSCKKYDKKDKYRTVIIEYPQVKKLAVFNCRSNLKELGHCVLFRDT